MELTQLVQRAQEALDRGEFQVVDAACRHALATYPTCLSAHRLLGEACIEQGRIEEAVERFGLALVLDPLDVVSYLGMGVAAEELGDLTAAQGYYFKAWELNPALEQLRDELIRIEEALHGSGRLQRTRAGLAGLYARTGHLSRAATEWRAVVAAEPASVPARTALIEVLWRQADDGAALTLCREVLAVAPETARVLAILADIEQRRALPAASTTATTYRSLDPSGDVLASLLTIKPQAHLAWLLPEPAMVPPFDFDAAARIDTPVPALIDAGPSLIAGPEAPVIAASAAASQIGPAPDLWDNLVRDLDSGSGDTGDLAPFAWPTDDAEVRIGVDDPAGAAPIGTTSLADTPLDDLLTESLDDLFVESVVGFEPATSPNSGAGDALAAFAAAEPAAPPAPAPDPFVTADGRVDLTVGWDDLDRTLAEATPSGDVDGFDELIAAVGAEGVAPFDPLAGGAEEWEPFGEDDFGDWSEELEPTQAAEAGGDAALAAVPAQLYAADEPAPIGGIDDDFAWPDDPTPVEPVAAPVDSVPAASVEALVDATDAVVVPEEPLQPTFADLDAVQALTVGWDAIEEEMAAAMPPTDTQALFDGLEAIDDEGLVPFDFAGAAEAVDPLANPDAVGAPLDFDDLLLVTSRDATGPLSGDFAAGAANWSEQDDSGEAMPPDGAGFAEHQAVAPALPDQEPAPFAGIEPFAFDEMAPAPADDAIDFSDVEGLPPTSVGAVDDFGFFDEPADAPVATAGTDEDAVIDWPAAPWSAEPDQAVGEEPIVAATDEANAVVADWPAIDIDAATVGASASDAAVLPDSGVEVTSVTAEAAGDEVAVAPVTESDRAGSSVWPAFVSGTSDLVDRAGEMGAIFARLREEKASLVGLGLLQLDRSLTRRPAADGEEVAVPVPVPVGINGHAADEGIGGANGRVGEVDTAGSAVSPQVRAEVTEWRERLRLDPAAADEVVVAVERRIADDGPEPLYLRVLGEAYVKLGRSDLAATRFRAATLGRLRRP